MLSLLVLLTGCPWLVNPENAEQIQAVGETAKTVGAALPPPFGWIVSLLGTGAVGYGMHLAGKKRAEAVDPAKLSPVAKVLAERKWSYPLLGAVLAGAKGAGVLPIDDESMMQILAMFGLPAVGEFAKDAFIAAKAKPPAPTA